LFLALNDVKLDYFSVSNAAEILLWVVFNDCRLMHEDVFLGVITVYEAVP